MDHDHHDHDHGHQHAEVDHSALSPAGRALLATAAISVLPTLILLVIPIGRKGQGLNQGLHRALLAFAAGGLLGDVFLHSIPHLLGEEHHHDESEADHDHHDHHEAAHDAHTGHDHSHGTMVGLSILLGFITFFLFEKIMRNHGGHDHQQSDKKSDDAPPGPRMGAGAYLNLAADSLHNFTDGIAIGAAYVAGKGVGLATALSVLVHELPHEIGDFAILVQNGCSAQKAILLQFCTAIFAFVGTGVGLLSTHYDDLADFLLAFVSGGFVYVATLTVMPELQVGRTSFLQTVLEIMAFSAGVGLMVIVAMLE